MDCPCGAKTSTKCGGCGVARYCSRECQKKDWPRHKTKCSLLKAAREGKGSNQKSENTKTTKDKNPPMPAKAKASIEEIEEDEAVEVVKKGKKPTDYYHVAINFWNKGTAEAEAGEIEEAAKTFIYAIWLDNSYSGNAPHYCSN